jgi:hypothetical protein
MGTKFLDRHADYIPHADGNHPLNKTMHSAYLIYLGDLRFTVALAGAAIAWLIVARAYRLAAYWFIAAGGALMIVATSKIIYLGWGVHFAPIDFKAASGHAAGAAAVLPIVLYLVASCYGRTEEHVALFGGWLISIAVACALVMNDEHSASEALAGWSVGALASACTWLKMREANIPVSIEGVGAALATTILLSACMQVVPLGWWMIKTTLLLSGAQRVHGWND